jgi:hypothetical protein
MQSLPLNSIFWTAAMPLAQLAIRVDELASKLGLPVHTWVEDGLGPARGFGCRLSSSRIFVLEELALAVEHQGAPGPTAYVDAAEMALLGVEPLVEELLMQLSIAKRLN